jgi:hypothetical protein
MAEGLIQAGETIVLQRYNYMRTHVLNPSKGSITFSSFSFYQLGLVYPYNFIQLSLLDA